MRQRVNIVIDRPDPSPASEDRRIRERDERCARGTESIKHALRSFADFDVGDHVAQGIIPSAKGEASSRDVPYVWDLFELAFSRGHKIAGVCNADVVHFPDDHGRLGNIFTDTFDGDEDYDVLTVTRWDVHVDTFEACQDKQSRPHPWDAQCLDPFSSADLVVLTREAWDVLRAIPELRRFAFAESHWDSCLINLPAYKGLKVNRSSNGWLVHCVHPSWWQYRGEYDMRAERIYQGMIRRLAKEAGVHKEPFVHLFCYPDPLCLGTDVSYVLSCVRLWEQCGWRPIIHGGLDFRFSALAQSYIDNQEIIRGRYYDAHRRRTAYYRFPVMEVFGGWFAAHYLTPIEFSPDVAATFSAKADPLKLFTFAHEWNKADRRAAPPAICSYGTAETWKLLAAQLLEHRHLGRAFQAHLQENPRSPLYASTTLAQLMAEWIGPFLGLEHREVPGPKYFSRP